MRERNERNALRLIIAEKLYEFHRLLLAQSSRGAEDLLLRAEISSVRCPACGAQMVLRGSIATADLQDQDHVFACTTCGLSYFTRDYIPVSSRSI
jgi:predicted RNA-binding Zn-ribbon protein involved in translation (DUF1610 family)